MSLKINRNVLRLTAAAALTAAVAIPAHAEKKFQVIFGDSVQVVYKEAPVTQLLRPAKRQAEYSPERSHFCWGASLGSSIDLTGQNMTAFDFCGIIGYKNKVLRFAGVGGGIKMMMTNSGRSFPVFAMVRTGFSTHPTLCFFEAKGGISFNHLPDGSKQQGAIAGAAIGVTLAHGIDFSSHISVGYDFTHLTDVTTSTGTIHYGDIHAATIRLGVSF